MASRVFINYRRDDSIASAGRVHDRLAQAIGRKRVFMDIDHIPAGVDFVDYLDQQVSAADVVLVVIGPHWLDAADEHGRHRLHNPDDFVAVEIASALDRKIRVIPVLIDGARMPKAEALPDRLKSLSRRNAVEVRNSQFGRDADALVERVREALSTGKPRNWSIAITSAALVGAVAGVVGLYLIALTPGSPPPKGHVQPPTARQANAASCDGIMVAVGSSERRCMTPASGVPFNDCPTCPSMVVVPSGRFTMGSPQSEWGREFYFRNTEDQLLVTLAKPFAVGRFAVTRGEFAAFVAATGYKTDEPCFGDTGQPQWTPSAERNWRTPGFAQDDSHPMVCVNRDYAGNYVAWLAEQTGKPYRLLSNSEREYVARAGTGKAFWTGETINAEQANFNGIANYPGSAPGPWRRGTVPVELLCGEPLGASQRSRQRLGMDCGLLE